MGGVEACQQVASGADGVPVFEKRREVLHEYRVAPDLGCASPKECNVFIDVVSPHRATAYFDSATVAGSALRAHVGRSGADDPFDRNAYVHAVAGWYELHHLAVFQHVRRMVGVTIAADVTHDVFVSVLRGHPRIDPARGSIRGLLVTIGHCRAIDFIRQNEAERRRDTRHPTQPARADGEDVAAAIGSRDVAARVRAALDTLPTHLRQPLVLAFYAHRTHRQVAVELGIPEGTVKSRIRRGLQLLHPMLMEDR